MGMVGKGHAAAALLTLKKPVYQLYRNLGWRPTRFGRRREIFPPLRDSIPSPSST